jgi:glutathione S-transferase
MKLVIGNKNYSSWSMRPWVAMRHFDIDFDEEQLWMFTESWPQDIAVYGSNTVPVLVTEQGNVVDSLAILETLAEDYPHMWPRDKHLRAKAREACARMHSGFFAMRSEMPMNCRAVKRKLTVSDVCRKDIAAVEQLWAECMALSGNDNAYLFGDFSIADAFFAPVVMRFQAYDVPLSETTQGYMQRMLATPAIAEWVAAGQAETHIIAEDEAGEEV